MRTGVPKEVGRVGGVNPGSDYVTKFGTRRGLLFSDVAPTRHRGPYTGAPLSDRLAPHIPRGSGKRQAFPERTQARI